MSEYDEVKRIKDAYGGYDKNRASDRWSLENEGNRREWIGRWKLAGQLLNEYQFYPLENQRILEIGCGAGGVLGEFCKLGASPQNLLGIDLVPSHIEKAKKKFPDIRFLVRNAEELTDIDEKDFDVVLLFTVLSSILDPAMREAVAGEAKRLLRPQGMLLIYDFRVDNPRNAQTTSISKRDLSELFPSSQFRVDARSITLLPPLARRLGPLTRILYPLLNAVPVLRSHYMTVVQEKALNQQATRS